MNPTPVPDVSPRLPNTIAITVTAVPQSPGMPWMRRYSVAFLADQESNTAMMARRSCSVGSCGKGAPVRPLTTSLKVCVTLRSSSAGTSGSVFTPSRTFTAARCSSNASRRMPSTTLPNIEMNRR